MDFDKARFNMIEQQIRPWNVLNQQVLDLLNVVKRERFVCPSLQKLAFTDCDLPIRTGDKDTGEFMLSPKMEARMLQDLALTPQDKVLEIGAGTGYMAALMAQLCAHVTTVEANPAIAELARNTLKANSITRVKVVDGCGFALAPTLGQFDAIVMSGASPVLPDVLLDALKPGGRLLGIVGTAPVLQLVLVTKSAQGDTHTKALLETDAKTLANAPKAPSFVF
ncbi:MAG: protein-L-isoaspartate O-methyltransferase family protein [Limnobacter sp.]|uniref:protein-L-isoaspartate O-methyltransferase family protein n=1 Tax=Limnobacter sp. TaxID=2003368 RepID=UPI00391BBF27